MSHSRRRLNKFIFEGFNFPLVIEDNAISSGKEGNTDKIWTLKGGESMAVHVRSREYII